MWLQVLSVFRDNGIDLLCSNMRRHASSVYIYMFLILDIQQLALVIAGAAQVFYQSHSLVVAPFRLCNHIHLCHVMSECSQHQSFEAWDYEKPNGMQPSSMMLIPPVVDLTCQNVCCHKGVRYSLHIWLLLPIYCTGVLAGWMKTLF